MTGFQHGTVNGYGNRNCRCSDCRAAHAAAMKRRRAQWKANNFPSGQHGTYYLYSMGCRCDGCRNARRAYAAERANRR